MTRAITNGSFVVVTRPNEKRPCFPQPRYRDSGGATETEHVRTRECLSGRTARNGQLHTYVPDMCLQINAAIDSQHGGTYISTSAETLGVDEVRVRGLRSDLDGNRHHVGAVTHSAEKNTSLIRKCGSEVVRILDGKTDRQKDLPQLLPQL